MDSRIIYTNSDGNVSVIVPADECGLTIEEIQAKDVPQGITSFIVDVSSIPDGREWRDAWTIVNGQIVVDEAKKPAIIVKRFNVQQFLVACQNSFTGEEKLQAMPYQRPFESLLDDNPPARDFSGFKTAVLGLIQAGVLTQSHYTKMCAACALQEINLDAIPS